MEAAIRNALDRAESPDKAARARIYHSAFEALKRNLEKKGVQDQDLLQAQSGKLKDLIVRIEAEYSTPAPMAAPVSDLKSDHTPSDIAPMVEAETPPANTAAAPEIRLDKAGHENTSAPVSRPDRKEPEFGLPPETKAPEQQGIDPTAGDAKASAEHDQQVVVQPDRGTEQRSAAPVIDTGDRPFDDGLTLPPANAVDAERDKDTRRKDKKASRNTMGKRKRGARHIFASGFSGLVLLSFFGIGLWWVFETGGFQSAETRDTSVANPPPKVSSEDYEGNGSSPRPLNPDAGFSSEWTTLYAPQADEPIEAGSDTELELARGETGNSLQFRSTNSGESGEVSIPIDAAALQQLVGQKVVIALTTNSINEEVVQYYVKCDFGTLGDCGRHRFEAGNEITDALFVVDFTRQLAPNEDGKILINGDVFGTGRGVELYSVRARPAN